MNSNDIQYQLQALDTFGREAAEVAKRVKSACQSKKVELVTCWLVSHNPLMPKKWCFANSRQDGRIVTRSHTLSLKVCQFLEKWLGDKLPIRSYHRAHQPKLVLPYKFGNVEMTLTLIRHESDPKLLRGWFSFPSWSHAVTAVLSGHVGFDVDLQGYRKQLRKAIASGEEHIKSLKEQISAAENRIQEHKEQLEKCLTAMDVQKEMEGDD